MPKRERSPPSSPPQLPPHKAPRSDRPVSPPPNQDRPEVEGPDGQEHQDQPEFEGPDDQEHRDQPEFEGPDDQEHQGQPEFEGPDDQELEDKLLVITTPLLRTISRPYDTSSLAFTGSPSHNSSSFTSQAQVLNPPLFPAEASIPHYSDLKLFTAAETHPWDPNIVGTVPIIAMIQATLTKRIPIPANFLFPHRVPPVRAPIPVVGYLSGLITGANVLALYRAVAPAWPASSHPINFRSQPSSTPLWRITVAYAALEEDHMIAYWESTHYLEITSVMTDADSDLFTYHQDRRQRRIRAGESWRKLLGEVVLMLRAKWADIDILPDPYSLHLPTKQDR
ncbi:hypothetical protein PHMEG_00032910, partial [Phytophthora megakarya]